MNEMNEMNGTVGMNESCESSVTAESPTLPDPSPSTEEVLPTEAAPLWEEGTPTDHGTTDTLPSPEEESARLREELESLRRELTEAKEAHARQVEELAEFQLLFPTVSLKEIPQEVRRQTESGIPLCAAYALYEKKTLAAEQRAKQVNKRNASLSAGKAGMDAGEEYFSPDEVRAMSLGQVRENYTRIKESMKSWI